MDIALRDIYRNPSLGLSSLTNLYKKARESNKQITLKDVKEFLNSSYSKQIHRKVSKPRNYFPITSSHENDIIQIDLMDVSNLSTRNKNFKWLFCCVDVYTRKAYVFPMKDKTNKNIMNAFNNFIVKNRRS